MDVYPFSNQNEVFSTLALSGGSLIGDRVVNLTGLELGKVEELMVDQDAGRVAYVIISTSNTLTGEKLYYPVPWDLLSVDVDKRCFVTQLAPENLAGAPHYVEKPVLAPPGDWLANIYHYYGAPIYWQSP